MVGQSSLLAGQNIYTNKHNSLTIINSQKHFFVSDLNHNYCSCVYVRLGTDLQNVLKFTNIHIPINDIFFNLTPGWIAKIY